MLLKQYIKKTRSYSTERFIFELTAIAIISKLLVAFLVAGPLIIIDVINAKDLPSPTLPKSSIFFTFLLLCIFAPILETIIVQWFPIKILQKITSRFGLVIGIDSIIFALAHWSNGFIYMAAVLPAGIVLAWSFILNADYSTFKALWVTSSIHALNNFVAFVAIIFL